MTDYARITRDGLWEDRRADQPDAWHPAEGAALFRPTASGLSTRSPEERSESGNTPGKEPT